MIPAGESELDREAAHWVAEMDRAWSPDQEAALCEWLRADARRQGALLRAQAMWLTPDCIAVPENHEGEHDAGPLKMSARRRDLIAGSAGAIAASLIAGVGWIARGDRYRTDVGEIRHVPLADGSIAAINTASDIEVDLGRRRRAVRLEQGEAWFQVAKDTARPFVVRAGPVSVEAIGTAFSVRRRYEAAEVLVNEGVVGVLKDSAPDLIADPLIVDPYVIAARKGHPLAGKSRIDVADLVRYDWVVVNEGAPRHAAFCRLFQNSPDMPSTTIETHSLATIRMAVAQSDRLTLLTRSELRIEEEAGALTALVYPGLVSAPVIGITRRRDWMPTPEKQTILELMHVQGRALHEQAASMTVPPRAQDRRSAKAGRRAATVILPSTIVAAWLPAPEGSGVESLR